MAPHFHRSHQTNLQCSNGTVGTVDSVDTVNSVDTVPAHNLQQSEDSIGLRHEGWGGLARSRGVYMYWYNSQGYMDAID